MSWWTGTGRCFLREKYKMIDAYQWREDWPLPLCGVKVTQFCFCGFLLFGITACRMSFIAASHGFSVITPNIVHCWDDLVLMWKCFRSAINCLVGIFFFRLRKLALASALCSLPTVCKSLWKHNAFFLFCFDVNLVKTPEPIHFIFVLRINTTPN